jgi:hypothetical protein
VTDTSGEEWTHTKEEVNRQTTNETLSPSLSRALSFSILPTDGFSRVCVEYRLCLVEEKTDGRVSEEREGETADCIQASFVSFRFSVYKIVRRRLDKNRYCL